MPAISGYMFMTVKCTLADSNEISFRLAGNAFSNVKNAGPKICFDFADVEIMVPSDRMGDVIKDLQGRRDRYWDVEPQET